MGSPLFKLPLLNGTRNPLHAQKLGLTGHENTIL